MKKIGRKRDVGFGERRQQMSWTAGEEEMKRSSEKFENNETR